MMGWQTGDQRQLFYLFNLERRIPASHLLRRINPIVMQVLADLREKLAPFYSDIGRPSIDPELMIRMLILLWGGDCARWIDSRLVGHLGTWASFKIWECPLPPNSVPASKRATSSRV